MVKALNGQLEDAQTRRATLAKELSATPPMLATEAEGGAAATAATRLDGAEQKLLEMRSGLTDDHPDVIAPEGLIAALEVGQPRGRTRQRAAGEGRRRRSGNGVQTPFMNR